MAENPNILNTAVSLLIRAALLAARFSGRVRQRYLNQLLSTGRTRESLRHPPSPVSPAIPFRSPFCSRFSGHRGGPRAA